MTRRTRRRATVGLGLLFSYPAFRTWSDGGIGVDTFAIRIAVAMVVAYVAVTVLVMLVEGYTQDETLPARAAADRTDADIEDAVVVEPPQEP